MEGRRNSQGERRRCGQRDLKETAKQLSKSWAHFLFFPGNQVREQFASILCDSYGLSFAESEWELLLVSKNGNRQIAVFLNNFRNSVGSVRILSNSSFWMFAKKQNKQQQINIRMMEGRLLWNKNSFDVGCYYFSNLEVLPVRCLFLHFKKICHLDQFLSLIEALFGENFSTKS